jgi:peptidoglycan/xylan/chitin deacetylase (PgdA/CDA1 family)/predicted small lipoprotein YifL
MRSNCFSSPIFLAALPLLALAGCGKKEVAKAPAKPAGPPKVSADVLQKEKPNEAGAVMVIMYHRFLSDEPESDLNRRPETFKKDLETLRAKNYYPVNALEFVTNTMDVPAGKTPVVITFDDALPSQFHVIEKDGEAKIDPNCAVGIMENFSKKYPDWPMKATFFVLPKEGRNAEPFGQAETVADKFQYLVKKGYEVANHTSTHSSLRGMDAKKIQWELATAHKDIKAINDGAAMETLALPYGKMPRKEDAQKALLSGSDGGTSYQHKAVFLAAWRPVMSPISKADKKFTEGGSIALFDTTGLERVTPDARHAKSPGTLEYWLAYFDKNPNLRYVSDGDARVAAVPESLKNAVDENRAKAQGKIVQFYGGSKKSGSGLSVD